MIVQPKIIGRRINLHPLAVLFAIFAGYEIMGVIGIIIGMPVAGTVKIILTRWLPVLGSELEVHAPDEPLLLDIRSGIKDVYRYARGRGESETKSAPPGAELDETDTVDGDEKHSDEDE